MRKKELNIDGIILPRYTIIEPWHEISTNMVCATSKVSDQPAHMRSLIRAFASPLNILSVKLLTEHHFRISPQTCGPKVAPWHST